MNISLVVPTRNRASRLSPFFDAIDTLGIDGIHSEFILVDNGSTDDTAERFQAFAKDRPGFRLVREDRQGLGAARNKGWRASSGRIIAFTDDDCFVQPGFLESYLAIFDANPDVGWAGGRILLHDPNDDPVTIDECDHVRHYPARRYVPCGAVHGANFAFRRAVLEEIDGFDPRTGAGTAFACEDVDTEARASFHGWNGLFDPRPVVRHNHGRRNGLGLAMRETIYAEGSGAYHAKCILSPRMRWIYLRHFAGRFLRQPSRIMHRELKAAVHFWWRSAFPLPIDARQKVDR